AGPAHLAGWLPPRRPGRLRHRAPHERDTRPLPAQAGRQGDEGPQEAPEDTAPGREPGRRGARGANPGDALVRSQSQGSERQGKLAGPLRPTLGPRRGPRLARGLWWHRGRGGQIHGGTALVVSAVGQADGATAGSVRGGTGARGGEASGEPDVQETRACHPPVPLASGAGRRPACPAVGGPRRSARGPRYSEGPPRPGGRRSVRVCGHGGRVQVTLEVDSGRETALEAQPGFGAAGAHGGPYWKMTWWWAGRWT